MPAHLWRHDASPRCGRRSRRVFLSVIQIAAIGTAITAIAASSIHADSIKTGAPADTEHLFGFVEGADIGRKGDRELVVDSTLRTGRSTGFFADTASELEFKYTAF